MSEPKDLRRTTRLSEADAHFTCRFFVEGCRNRGTVQSTAPQKNPFTRAQGSTRTRIAVRSTPLGSPRRLIGQ